MADTDSKNGGVGEVGADIALWVLLFLVVVALLGRYFGIGVGLFDTFVDGIASFFAQERLMNALAIIFAILNIILVALAVVIFRWWVALLERPLPAETQARTFSPKEEVKKNWEHVRELANSPSPSDWNMAILNADALLDDILQRLGYQGETIAERLKIVDPTKLRSLENVWSAHRLRNMIAHNPKDQHTRETIVYALRSYEQALKELGMMEEEVVAEKKMP